MTVLQQGNVILHEMEGCFKLLDEKLVEDLHKKIKSSKRVFFIGAGRSRLMLSAFCMRLNHLGFEAYVAGNIPCPPVQDGDLVIAATGSGETPSVIGVLKRIKTPLVFVIVITACARKVPSDIADAVISVAAPDQLIHGGTTGTYQLMRTLFEQTVFLLAESIILSLGQNIPQAEIAARHTNLE